MKVSITIDLPDDGNCEMCQFSSSHKAEVEMGRGNVYKVRVEVLES